MVTIVFWTCITPYLALGPFDTPGPDIENCRTYWWHNLLYITNIADVDTMVPYCIIMSRVGSVAHGLSRDVGLCSLLLKSFL